MIKIIRFRPLQFKDVQYAKLIKPFEDAGLVEDMEPDIKKDMALVFDVCSDISDCHYHFGHVLNFERSTETPSTLYHHIHNRDEMLPTLWVYRDDDGYRRKIKAIRSCHELQALLNIALNRGYVTSSKRLV